MVVVVMRGFGRGLVTVTGMIGGMGVHHRMGVVRMVIMGVGAIVVVSLRRRAGVLRVVVSSRVGVGVLDRMSVTVLVPVHVRRRSRMPGFRMGLVAVARVVGMLVVRLVLVAHGDPIPRPLHAVFQRQKAV